MIDDGTMILTSELKEEAPTTVSVSSAEDDGDNATRIIPAELAKDPRVTEEEEAREYETMSEGERTTAYADVFGRRPPGSELEMEALALAVESELRRIKSEEKQSLLRAQRVFPRLLCDNSHARQFLRAEDYDPVRAARRMCLYWERREELLGEGAFSPDSFQTLRDEDYPTLYNELFTTVRDPGADSDTKQMALDTLGDFVSDAISCLDAELEKIPPHERAALVQAQRSRPDLASSQNHKLLFLRSVDFQAERAARRMVNYWQTKVDLFGDGDAMFRPVTIETLEREHPYEMSLGVFYPLLGRDLSGRALFCARAGELCGGKYSHKGILKVIWYMLHCFLEEESVRKNGLVGLVLTDGMRIEGYDFSIRAKIFRLWMEVIPIKIKASHVFPPRGGVANSWFFRFIRPVVKWLAGRRFRGRIWIHDGDEEQTLRELELCGISRDQIPVEVGGNFRFDSVRAWLDKRSADGF